MKTPQKKSAVRIRPLKNDPFAIPLTEAELKSFQKCMFAERINLFMWEMREFLEAFGELEKPLEKKRKDLIKSARELESEAIKLRGGK